MISNWWHQTKIFIIRHPHRFNSGKLELNPWWTINDSSTEEEFIWEFILKIEKMYLSLFWLVTIYSDSTFPIRVSCQIMNFGSLFNELREFPKYKPSFSPNILILVWICPPSASCDQHSFRSFPFEILSILFLILLGLLRFFKVYLNHFNRGKSL